MQLIGKLLAIDMIGRQKFRMYGRRELIILAAGARDLCEKAKLKLFQAAVDCFSHELAQFSHESGLFLVVNIEGLAVDFFYVVCIY